MTSHANTRSHAFGAHLHSGWNAFARTPSGDMVATFVAIVVMFGTMFGLASLVALGTEGVKLLLHLH